MKAPTNLVGVAARMNVRVDATAVNASIPAYEEACHG
jgi:hypothetical protein